MANKNTDGEAVELEVARRGSVAIPWTLFVAALGAGGAFYFHVHRPLASELVEKDTTIATLRQTGDAAFAEAAEAKAAHAIELEKAQDELKKTRDDLARTAAERELDAKILAELKAKAGAGGAEIEGAGGQITVTMVDRILFKSGDAELSPAGQEMLRRLGEVFKGTDKLIEVSGHADNQPVESRVKARYPTNWELSTARATNVVRFLEEQVGIKPRRLKAAGFGASRPVASNAKASGRARNRRIEMLLLPDNMKVVKGDFSDEIAAANPVAAQSAPAKSTAHRPAHKKRSRSVAAERGNHAAKKRSHEI